MKNKATLLSLAVAGLFAASAAHATADLTVSPTTSTAKFASEIVISSTVASNNLTNSGTAVATAAGLMDVKVKLGFGLSANQQKYIRFDLSNGATWGTALTSAMMADGTTAANIFNVTLAQGGAATDSWVVYQITANTMTGTPLTDVIFFAPPTINIGSTAGNVVVGYSLHDTPVSAVGVTPTNATRLVSTSGTLITFASANKFTFGTPATEIAAATKTFQQFCTGTTPGAGSPGTAGCAATATDVDAVIGTISSYIWDVTVADKTGTLLTAFAPVTSNTTSTINLAGDFSGAASTYVDSTANQCTNTAQASIVAAAPTATTAKFTPAAAFSVGAGGTYAGPVTLCFKATGTTALSAQTITGTFNPLTGTAGTYLPVASAATPTGIIARDGVELQAPWFTLGGTGTAYISRFFLTNTGSTSITCTVAFMSEAGNTVTVNLTPNAQGNSGAGVTIPANGQIAVTGTDLVTSLSGNARAAVRFSCPAPSANVQGRYVVTHVASGAVDSGTLLRPGTN